METTIKIDGKDVRFKATAAVPRLYRICFGRDIIQDIHALQKALDMAEKDRNDQKENYVSHLPVEILTIFESVAYIMAKHAAPQEVPGSPEEWLDEFETFSIYQILPQILILWRGNTSTSDLSKKKAGPQRGK